MTRLNLLLVLIAVLCAIGVVTSQHKARKLFTDLQQEQEQAKRMDVEWGQLQLEQSTWAMHARIEKIATAYLGMQVPDVSRIQVVPTQEKPEQDKGARP
jgi:cell division protein FtsL